MNWTQIQPGSVRLNRLRADAALDGYDPYLIWADLTNFAGFSGLPKDASGKEQIPVAVELVRNYVPGDFTGVFAAPAIYRQARFCTGLVPHDKLVAFRALLRAGERFKLGLPAIPQVDTQPRNFAPAVRPVPVVIGIIDHGCAFANRAFRDPATGKTRVKWVWDQDRNRLDAGRNAGNHWQRVRELGYGGELDAGRIDALIQSYPDESRLYREISYEPAFRDRSHGTMVMDLACGGPNPLRHVAGFPNADPADNSRNFEGPASTAPIIVVQLPYRPAKDTSGASLCVHILDALHYIRRRALNFRLVVNLSDGAMAGPHDGTSLLESALDNFLAASQRTSLVVAAGNGFELNCHARQRINANSSGAPLNWRVLPDDFTDSFLEVWLNRTAGAAVTLSIRPPGAAAAQTVAMGEIWIGDRAGTPLCCVVAGRNSPNGPGRGSFLVALAPTRPRSRASSPAPHGVWEITVGNNTGTAIDVDTWIERDNPALGDTGPLRQSYFVKNQAGIANTGTVNSVATGAETIVVGGFYGRGRLFQEIGGASRLTEVARYSSSGPGHPDAGNRYDGPDVSAPSDESPVLRGLRASANRSGSTFRMDGTSVAAPIVTRRIANMLSAAIPPPLGQVKARLQIDHAKTRATVELAREGAGRIKPGKES